MLSTFRPRASNGFSLPELIVVVAIVGLSVAVAIPLISREIQKAQIRGAVDQFASNLRAARMIAVSTHRPVDVRVFVAPGNYYLYKDAREKERRITMPEGIAIVWCEPDTLVFRSDGSVMPDGGETRFEARTAQGAVERWTVKTSVLGIPKTTHEQVEP
jgi:prepilin-type N-terminal cleavage/methylation domain-containing protein